MEKSKRSDIKNLNVHYKKRKNKVTLDSGQVIYDKE